MPATATPPDEQADESDESLMQRYGAGDMAAFERLYARHELGVWRYLLRSVRRTEVADDLTQDVWFAVVRQAETYEPGGRCAGPPQARPAPSGGSALHEVKSVGATFKTWLFTIAHNRLIDHFRTTKNHTSLDAETADGDTALVDTLAADSGFGPVRQLESREQAVALIAAVEALPTEQRHAFLLQAEAGMSVDEIARVTSASFETTKSRLRYARSQLRQLLKEFA
jgi:RNA polymerase sigma factor (sigma-70 family)